MLYYGRRKECCREMRRGEERRGLDMNGEERRFNRKCEYMRAIVYVYQTTQYELQYSRHCDSDSDSETDTILRKIIITAITIIIIIDDIKI
jgi:hypothetical protein